MSDEDPILTDEQKLKHWEERMRKKREEEEQQERERTERLRRGPAIRRSGNEMGRSTWNSQTTH